MVITEKLKERFCKDRNLPIRIFSEPYFTKKLELLDCLYDCIAYYKKFCALVEKYGDEQAYFEAYNKVKDLAINYLNENPVMTYFSKEADFSKYPIQNKDFPASDIFKQTNDGKMFVSIDMKKANFTALRHYSKEIVGGKETYEEFLGMFTDEDYFKESKYIRQVIFGNVNPKRQTTYEKFLMDKVLTRLLTIFDASKVAYFSTDEIVIELSDMNSEAIQFINQTVLDFKQQGVNIRADFFKLEKVKGDTGAYIKHMIEDEKSSFDIKCVESHILPFIIRKMKGEEPKEEDFVIVFEGLMAKLMTSPHIEIVS